MAVPAPPWVSDPPARRRLGVAGIVGAGLEILASEGIDAVTMRAVAARLGTGAASLYAHVRDKKELHQLMLDEVLVEVAVPPADRDRWQEQLKQACRSYYAALTRHPGIALVNVANIPTGPNALRCGEALLAILLAGGLSRTAAGLAVDLVTLYPNAVAFEDAIWGGGRGAAGGGPATERAVVDRVRATYAALPTDRFPLLASMAVDLTSGDGEARFEFGLAVVVAGLEQLKGWQLPEQ
jgi:AcrR family transcriptional regulator